MLKLRRRVEQLEQAHAARLTPLERAFELLEQHVPPEQWPDAELNAYCDTLPPEIQALSDGELEALIEQAD